MILAKRRRPGGGDPAKVAARLMPVAQFVGDLAQLEGDREHHRVGVAVP
jgi:hypothetical protein